MVFNPFPVPVPFAFGVESAVEENRNLYCPLYDRCLDTAVKNGWQGWTCNQCQHFRDRQGQPGADEFAHDRRSDAFSR